MTDLSERRDIETEIYEPAEDSRLLAATAVEHIDSTDRVVDVGTGSGYVGATVAETTGATVIGTDINPHACQTAAANGVETVRADLVAPFAERSVDVVVCNPPYLPAESGADFDDWMAVALTGGENGRALINRLIADVGRVLKPDGRVLLLVSTLTGVDAVIETATDSGFQTTELATDAYPFETLVVLELKPA